MSGRLPQDVRKWSVDNVSLHRPHVGALTGCFPTPAPLPTIAAPPEWTREQHQLFLSHYDRTFHLPPLVGQHPFHHFLMQATSSQQLGSQILSKVPVSSAGTIKNDSASALPIQAPENNISSDAVVVTPPKLSPCLSSKVATATATPCSTQEISLAEELMYLHDDTRWSLFFVAIHVERPSLDQPWGLEFSKTEDHRLLVSKVNWKPHVSQRWCLPVKVPSMEDPLYSYLAKNVYTTKPIPQCKNATEYASVLLTALSLASAHDDAAYPHQRQCRPGDLILAVDGHSLSSFGSVAAVADHLKSVTSTSIVVARYSKAEIAATSAMHGVKDVLVETTIRANQAWTELLHRPLGAKNHKSFVSRVLFPKPPLSPPAVILRNPWFKQEDGQDLPYQDNDMMYVPGDGTSADLFLRPIGNFQDWLSQRKTSWRLKYNVYKYNQEQPKRRRIISSAEEQGGERAIAVAKDFWTQQGFTSFDDWMTSRVMQWKMSYSWNKRKRKLIQQDCEEIVHISIEPNEFTHWLSVRRRQWRLQRRKRQRLRAETEGVGEASPKYDLAQVSNQCRSVTFPVATARCMSANSCCASKALSSDDKELAIMDEIIEAEEAQRRRREIVKRIPIDIAKFFDSSNGIPDDIVVKCFEYLERKEHVRLLIIDKATSRSLQARTDVWKSLCPSHWILPRRPRKPWHELYCSRLKGEHDQHQKRWDDLLVKLATILDASDSLCKIEKLVEEAEKTFGFDVNYVSGVVCERNSLLNLAVIHQRHKVTRWLVDVKKADIETSDRGNFTPLLNAAWEGDRTLVRYFLQKGSDRSVRGTGHYSKAIAPPGFEGMTADQWADERGHPDVAKLIRLGF